jgi:hypothetical protein
VARFLVLIAGAALGLGLAQPAQAAVALCVETHTEAADGEGGKNLVLSEVGRHPSHHVVDSNCPSRLRIELFSTGGRRYLTVQVDGEVPDRSTIADVSEVAPKVAESITHVLRSDPMHLSEDPETWSAVERAGKSVGLTPVATWGRCRPYRVALCRAARSQRQDQPGRSQGLASGHQSARRHPVLAHLRLRRRRVRSDEHSALGNQAGR